MTAERWLLVAVVAVCLYALAALVGFSLARAAEDPDKWQEPEDGIQGSDPYSVTLAGMGEHIEVEDMTPTLSHDC